MDPFSVLNKIAEQVEEIEDREWLQARLQFIVLSLTTSTAHAKLYDDEYDDDKSDDSNH